MNVVIAFPVIGRTFRIPEFAHARMILVHWQLIFIGYFKSCRVPRYSLVTAVPCLSPLIPKCNRQPWGFGDCHTKFVITWLCCRCRHYFRSHRALNNEFRLTIHARYLRLYPIVARTASILETGAFDRGPQGQNTDKKNQNDLDYGCKGKHCPEDC